MRNLNPPTGSSSFEPDRPAGEDTPPHSHHVGSATNTSAGHLNAPANDEGLQNAEPAYLNHFLAHTQSQAYTSAEGTEEMEEVDHIDEEETNDHDMVDVEDGGAPLHDVNMEEVNDSPLMSASQDTPSEADTEDIPTNLTTPQSLLPNALYIPNPPQQQLQQNTEEPETPDLGIDELEPHPDFLTNANPGVLMPDNHNALQFLQSWRWLKMRKQLREIRDTPYHESSITEVKRPRITYEELKGDNYDLQGINWQHIGVARSQARKCRIGTFRNYTNMPSSDAWNSSIPDRLLPRHENYFRFRSMDLRNDVRLLHFQLRNILACASRTAVYYPCTSSFIRELDPTTGQDKIAMKFRASNDASITTLTAGEGFLVAGGFSGSYRYRRTDTEDTSRCYDGNLTDHPSGISNHVQVCSSRRSSIPLAAFASNDYGFRVVDLARNQIISDKMYDYALNCTAISPDKRLRVMVGDRREVMIADAETGECLQRLEGHRDFGFACDWAPDGWTVATGNQDKSIRIWDARKWKNSKGESTSVAVMRAEMAGVRILRFSPLGSGKRLLLATEEADMINIIDAQTFNSKQTIDIFGELAGVSFASAGQEVLALSSDPVRGGVLCLERCDSGAEDTFNYKEPRYSQEWWRSPGYDWLPTPQEVVDHPGSQITLTQKRRQAAMAEDWFF
ncbi:WD40-repeat-containing domain protein [Xylaria nigripes]|nr:WD40-repeat-containing domain protein [Xylaria nigripes]